MIVELDESNFDEAICNGVVLVDFWAAWCGPCKLFKPTIEEIAQEERKITVHKVNVDEHPDLAVKYDVFSVPTLKFFKDGACMDTSVGVALKDTIKTKLEALQ
jgi:thioredoxin 1